MTAKKALRTERVLGMTEFVFVVVEPFALTGADLRKRSSFRAFKRFF